MIELKDQIKEILYGYVACRSITETAGEKSAEAYFLDYFGKQEYFKSHPEFYGAYPIEEDHLNRAAVFAMVRGEGDDAVVMIHHNDVVGVEDFKLLGDLAFSPDELNEALADISDTFADEAKADYESGGYLFGRGTCDMKGGGSIEMALLSRYAQDPSFRGNVIVLGVPDEENLSAGMRAGVKLLAELKEKYGLNYRLMINTEPHQRKDPDKGVFSFGSIGKLMPFVYIRGSLAHAGKVFEGINPTNIMAEIVRRTESNTDLSDVVGFEAAPPPTWLYLRENKEAYDVSMPLTIRGCLSVLTLSSMPGEFMERFKGICQDAFQTVVDDLNRSYEKFRKACNKEYVPLPWKAKVVDFGQLYEEARAGHGEEFERKYRDKLDEIRHNLDAGEESLIMANFDLVDWVYNYIDDLSPRIVTGLMPPYYPHVANCLGFEDERPEIAELHEKLNAFTEKTYGQTYVKEYYYTGISDLSYSGIRGSEKLEDDLSKNMPFFGGIYDLPLGDIEKISMPCVNIGPWGKDFHKLTERVLKEDLYVRTPEILNYAVKMILGE